MSSDACATGVDAGGERAARERRAGATVSSNACATAVDAGGERAARERRPGSDGEQPMLAQQGSTQASNGRLARGAAGRR